MLIQSDGGNETVLLEGDEFGLVSFGLKLKLLSLEEVEVHFHDLSISVGVFKENKVESIGVGLAVRGVEEALNRS
jgi:hypothetical protein